MWEECKVDRLEESPTPEGVRLFESPGQRPACLTCDHAHADALVTIDALTIANM